MVLALMAAAGCGGKDKPVKVSGVVTLDGAPLADAKVTYINTSGGRSAWGLTDSEGKFALTTITSNDGALPGEYKVTVEIQKEVGTDAAPVDPKDRQSVIQAQSALAAKQKDERPGKAADVKSPIHVNYTRADRTPLQQKVPSDGPVEIKLKKGGT